VRTEGPAALSERLANSTNFTTELIDRPVDGHLEGHSDTFSRVDLARDLARIVGALPPYEWIEHARRLAQRLDLPRATISQEAFEAGTNWTGDPQAIRHRGQQPFGDELVTADVRQPQGVQHVSIPAAVCTLTCVPS